MGESELEKSCYGFFGVVSVLAGVFAFSCSVVGYNPIGLVRNYFQDTSVDSSVVLVPICDEVNVPWDIYTLKDNFGNSLVSCGGWSNFLYGLHEVNPEKAGEDSQRYVARLCRENGQKIPMPRGALNPEYVFGNRGD